MPANYDPLAQRRPFFLDPPVWEALERRMQLTPRQAAIMKLVLRGCSDKQIAAELQCAIPTVRTHLTRLFTRLDVSDRVDLILYAFAEAQRYWQEGGIHHPR